MKDQSYRFHCKLEDISKHVKLIISLCYAQGTFSAFPTSEMSSGEFFKESSRCLFSNPSTANCFSASEDNVSLHIVILPNNCRGEMTLYAIGRPVRATTTLYPIGRPVS